MNIEKSKAYRKLVKAMQEKYPKYDENSNNAYELYAPYVNGEMICQEINLYTYWQGLGYEKNTPRIKYLFVAQDWGSLFVEDENLSRFLDRAKKINRGYKNIHYFDENYNSSMTDENLVKLFERLGYDLRKHNPDLFFTNFCLGYRRDREVQMTIEMMMSDAPLFKELCEILEPENIICMGRKTFECVYEALTDKINQEILSYSNFNEFLENHEAIKVRIKGNSVPLIPVAHCGSWGIINRNWKNDDPLNNQYRDWIEVKKIAKEYTHKTVPEALNSRRKSFADFLFELIDAKDLNDSTVYKKAGILRKTFSDIRSKKDYIPTKKTIIAIIFALRLSMEDSLELLSRAGYTLSSSSDFDLIVTHFISRKNFSQHEIDEELDRRGLPTIFPHFRDDEFSRLLIKFMKEKNMDESDICKKVNLKEFILERMYNKKDYKPKKKDLVAIIFALELSLEETNELLSKVDYVLSDNDNFDKTVKRFISGKNFNQKAIDEELNKIGLPSIFAGK